VERRDLSRRTHRGENLRKSGIRFTLAAPRQMNAMNPVAVSPPGATSSLSAAYTASSRRKFIAWVVNECEMKGTTHRDRHLFPFFLALLTR
jgi:hypothetical protein